MPKKPTPTSGPTYEFIVRGAPHSVMRGLRRQMVRAVQAAKEQALDTRGAPPFAVEVSTLRRAPEPRA